jgi:hypothetical protein
MAVEVQRPWGWIVLHARAITDLRRKGKPLRCGRPVCDTDQEMATWHTGRFRINGHVGDAPDPPRP